MSKTNKKISIHPKTHRPQTDEYPSGSFGGYRFPSSPPPDGFGRIILAPGTDIDRFTILDHIDSGGSADIYSARDNVSCKKVAVKIINAGPCGIDGTGEILRNEKLLYDKISDHSHIIKVYDIHSVKWAGTTLAVLSMELADGKTLARLLNESSEDVNWPKCFVQMTKAAAALHGAGIYHRDIKPDNFILSGGTWKLFDLGMAAAASDNNEGLYRREDIARLGGIFYNITQIRPGSLSGQLPCIIDRCLGKNGCRQYSDIQELLTDITQIGGQPLSDDSRIAELWERACESVAESRFCDAITVCERLLERRPSHQQAPAMLNELNARKTRAGQILAELENNSGRLSIEQKQNYLRQADSIYPNHPKRPQSTGWINTNDDLSVKMLHYAKAAVESGRWEKAAAALEHAAQLDLGTAAVQNAYQHISSVTEQIDSANRQKNAAVAEGDCQKAVVIGRAIDEYLENIKPQILSIFN